MQRNLKDDITKQLVHQVKGTLPDVQNITERMTVRPQAMQIFVNDRHSGDDGTTTLQPSEKNRPELSSFGSLDME